MNQLARHILTGLLADPTYWNKEGKPKMQAIQRAYTLARESIWLDEVYFPRYFRAIRLIKSMRIFPEDHFGILDADGIKGWHIVCENCEEIVQERLDWYFERIWQAPEWEYVEITLQDALAIQSVPPGERQLTFL